MYVYVTTIFEITLVLRVGKLGKNMFGIKLV